MNTQLGLILMVAGLLLALLGAIVYFAGGWPFTWLGRLPGDIRIGRGNWRVYIPLASSLLISLFLTLLFILVSRFRR